ncbi:helix-turn-helix transcriptional regulator [Allosphingosinicella indica]|uniref:helix-turn-helix transcriptional regulator n=1 Tax=Allosphingosinicella indica TaxID=941907 RepID=UPI000A163EC1|nr:AlpA family transcriptional regulator [Allosphingosinicella indica]
MPGNDRILRLGAVMHRTGLSRSTVYRKIKEGSFPRQVQLSHRCSGWRESAIDTWLADPMAFVELNSARN